MLRLPVVASLWTLVASAGAVDATFFENRVRPVLAANCYDCHTKTEMAGLRIDSRDRLLKGGKSGPAIVPGDAARSLLIQAVDQTHARLKMPPRGMLGEQQRADLRAWVDAGAPWPATEAPSAGRNSYWAFQPVVKPAPPKPANAAWARTAVDRFIAVRLEKAGIPPSPAANRRTLIRRATYDLTGLPPTPEEVDAFLSDSAPDAFAKVVNRLLSSPRYGERWGRHWLDLARYSDGRQAAREDTPIPNAWRYRDWVVKAFNEDLPYDVFVKAQIAADLMPPGERERLLAGLGFQVLGDNDDDRLDVTTRVFLGLTVGCARCHDHKYDPIPTRDYYSLLGVFKSSKLAEHPLVEPAVAEAYRKAKALLEEKQAELKRFLERQTAQVVDILAAQTGDYLITVWRRAADPNAPLPTGLDEETLNRWTRYLENPPSDHSHFRPWFDMVKAAGGLSKVTEVTARGVALELHAAVQRVIAEKKAMDDRNYVKLGGIEGMKDAAKVIKTLVDALPVERYYFWRDLASGPYKVEDLRFPGGVYHYSGAGLERFFSPYWKRYLDTLRGEVQALEKAVPPPYPFWHVLEDSAKPRNVRVAIRGDASNLGEEAPRRFLSALCDGEPAPFTRGSGRLELAEAIASPDNPLTARVMVNRIWKHHFGEGLARSTSNFGRLGEKPDHPELLDYLAARFVESGWSVKAMHREMMLSAVYQMRSDAAPASSVAKDADNRLFWRANVRDRLEAEALRDAIIAVSGSLDPSAGGPPRPFADDMMRRTLYATVSRGIPDRAMALFDFPDAASSSESRIVTVGPMQRLFFMNSGFVARHAKGLAERLARERSADRDRIERAYELLYSRPASEEEIRLGLEYLQNKPDAWPRYAQVLLSAAEFSAVK